jgi:hypothetical protein
VVHQEAAEVQVELVPEDQEAEEETNLINLKNQTPCEEVEEGNLKIPLFFIIFLPATSLYSLSRRN